MSRANHHYINLFAVFVFEMNSPISILDLFLRFPSKFYSLFGQGLKLLNK
jgi:hypothetical protein